MTTHPDYLQQLRDEWSRTCRQRESHRAMFHFAVGHPALRLYSLEHLGDLIDVLGRHGGRSVIERARIVEEMLVDATDPLLRRALLQTLIPGVVSVCRQLRFGAGIVDEPSETVAVAIALLTELLTDWAGQRRAYAAPDLLSALRGRLRRWLLKEKAARQCVTATHVVEVAANESRLVTRLEVLAQGPTERLARLTWARVMEGRSLDQLAADDHSSPQALRNELQVFALAHLIG